MGHCIETLEPRRLFAAGGLDSYFGTAGVADLAAVQGDAFAFPLNGLLIDSRGRIVAAASVSPTQGVFQPTVFRTLSGGQIDTTFGATGNGATPGHVNIDAAFASEFGHDVSIALAPDDRIILLGGINQHLLARLNADGSPDTTFGTGGVVHFDQLQPQRFGVTSDGRIVVVGFTGMSLHGNAATLRFTVDGSIDTTFGDGGLVVLSQWTPSADDTAGSSQLQDVVPLPDGKIVVGGTFTHTMNFGPNEDGSPDIEIITNLRYSRLNDNGSLDTTFGDNGIATSNQQGFIYDLTLAPDGSLVTALQSDDTLSVESPGILERIKSDGTIDSAFGGVGSVRAMDFPDPPGGDPETPIVDGFSIAGVLAQFDGKLIVFGDGGSFATGLRQPPIALGRFNADGSADTTFGTAGNGATDTSGASAGALDDVSFGALAADGSIVLLGIHQGSMRLARYWRDDAPAAQVVFKKNRIAPDAGPHVFKFAVSWRDDVGIDQTTLDLLDIRIDGPDGSTRKARPLATDRTPDGQVHVLYKFSAPNGAWDSSDNGDYKIRIRAHQVADTEGHFAQARTIGHFNVAIPAADRPSVTSLPRRQHDDGEEIVKAIALIG